MALSADDDSGQWSAVGRPEAIVALYDQYGARLFRVACSLISLPADAEDAVQEVFLGLVRGHTELERICNPRAYLFAALRRAALRLAERRHAEMASPASAFQEIAAPVPRTIDADRAEQLEHALSSLPAEQRELIALKIDGGLSFAEIALVLGISPNTAASRYRYAIEKLRIALGK